MKRLSLSLLLAITLAPALGLAQQAWQLSGFIYRSAIPFVIPSSGSFGTNGAVTLTTALPTTYGNAYLYFPAGAICASSAAGVYYAVMSSSTVGTVYNNTYTSGLPTIPATPTTYTCGTAPGAYTQTTASALTLITYQLAGGFLSINGALKFEETWDYANSSSTKTIATQLGGTSLFSAAPTTTAQYTARIILENQGITSAQVVDTGGIGANASHSTFTSIATASNQNITLTGNLASASDYIVLSGAQIAAMP